MRKCYDMRLVKIFIIELQRPVLMFPDLLLHSGQLQIIFLKEQLTFHE